MPYAGNGIGHLPILAAICEDWLRNMNELKLIILAQLFLFAGTLSGGVILQMLFSVQLDGQEWQFRQG